MVPATSKCGIFARSTITVAPAISLPSAIGNPLFATFYPALSYSANYIASKGGDTPCFRVVVAWSFGVGYAFALASLLTMPLMPNQKADAQARMATWPKHSAYALATITLVVLGLGYALTVSFLALTPLACLEIVGGQGCDAPPPPDVAQPCNLTEWPVLFRLGVQ